MLDSRDEGQTTPAAANRRGQLVLVDTIMQNNAGNAIINQAYYLIVVAGTTEIYDNGNTAATTCATNQYWTGSMQTTAPYKYTCTNCPAGRFARRYVVSSRAVFPCLSIADSVPPLLSPPLLPPPPPPTASVKKQPNLHGPVQHHRFDPNLGAH